MEKPDAQGFINVKWPSKNVPHGGIFHTRVVETSPTNKEFIKVLLEESKLSIEQRAKSAWALRQEEINRAASRDRCKSNIPLIRPRTSRRRSLSAIRESGVLEPDRTRPLNRGEDREQLKEKFAKLMTYGDADVVQEPLPSRPNRLKPKIPTPKEMRNELLNQIRERVDWLAEMEDLGEAEPHREVIEDQIVERLRSLEALGLDSKCCSARSSATAFSTLRGREDVRSQKSSKAQGTANGSVQSFGLQNKPKATRKLTRTQAKAIDEETVEAYDNMKYTPRRRV